MATIAVVVGSTRPQRICRGIAQWVVETANRDSHVAYDLVDLADVALPILDEPLMAAHGHYGHEYTKRWSRIVSGYDGFVFVMPQYSWGYTAEPDIDLAPFEPSVRAMAAELAAPVGDTATDA